ncbi:MAG TPA: signal recognition particle-docking protein FtsY [Ktedonobacterales bacterium]|nr:signal recognition particle-docking protein FtsY [Ktedonobacterales bacterium]
MFKRWREGLFKRPEEGQPQHAPPAEAATEAPAEAPPSEAPPADAPLAAPEVRAPSPAPSPAPPPVIAEPVVAQAPGLAEAEAEEELEQRAEEQAEEELIPHAEPAAAAQPAAQDSRGGGLFRNPFKLSLGRTRQLFGRVTQAFEEDEEISEDLWDELEETLITGDVGVQTTDKLMQSLRDRAQAEGMTHARQLREALKEELELMLGEPEPLMVSETSPISVYLVIGVNGVGKTTSIAKLGNQLKRQKHRVMLAAGDTFRAAAIEQLRTWGERVGLPVISHQHGADPGAVVYDAMQAAQARGADVLIVDTAGRLHTKFNLMEELKKIMRVLQKYDPEAPHEVLLVIDATVGQNGLLQAKQFVQDAGVSGVILTKLDGTARGGIVFAVASELGLPIKFIGTGEQVGDIAPFDPVEFVDALFEDD